MHQPQQLQLPYDLNRGRWEDKVFIWPLRVYYEDSDMSGHVFHANYLKYAERGRSEMIRAMHIPPLYLREKEKIYFVIRKIEVDFIASCFVDDFLEVKTDVLKFAPTNVLFSQEIMKQNKLIASLKVHMACMNLEGKITKLPEIIKEIYNQLPDLSFAKNRVLI
ncbi:MAG: YbgC/FadM family acyl-CoA thioesterase [Alphaproteobacteria bacterium]|nr:YbgC/FadM family acyl-CoA thioesterase [Alphaproteobacteria bacterium]